MAKKKPDLDDLEYELTSTPPTRRTATLLELLAVARRGDREDLIDFAIELEIDERTNGRGDW